MSATFKGVRVPDAALTAEPTAVPTRTVIVPDWDAFHKILQRQGWIVMDVPVENLRLNAAGTREAPDIKSFRSYLRWHKIPDIRVRRLSDTRWFITLKGESK